MSPGISVYVLGVSAGIFVSVFGLSTGVCVDTMYVLGMSPWISVFCFQSFK